MNVQLVKLFYLYQFKSNNFRFYCDVCENPVFLFQNVDDLDYDCFEKPKKMSINRRDVDQYLELSYVSFGKENTISVVYMNKISTNANLHKTEEFLSLMKNLPDIICVCETWLTSLISFVGKLHGYDFVNKLSNSNQSGGVAFFVRACHCYEVVEGVFFEQCDVDDLLISIKLENNKYLVLGNVYRHPSSTLNTFKENFLKVLDILNEKKKILMVM